MSFSWPDSWFNTALAKSPLNWLIVGVIATVWLLAFHAIMGGFTAMQAGMPGGAASAPGAAPAPVSPAITPLTQFPDYDPSEIFTDSAEAKYYGDGWLGASSGSDTTGLIASN